MHMHMHLSRFVCRAAFASGDTLASRLYGALARMDVANARLAADTLTCGSVPAATVVVQPCKIGDEVRALEADAFGWLLLLDTRTLALTKLPPAHLDASTPLADRLAFVYHRLDTSLLS